MWRVILQKLSQFIKYLWAAPCQRQDNPSTRNTTSVQTRQVHPSMQEEQQEPALRSLTALTSVCLKDRQAVITSVQALTQGSSECVAVKTPSSPSGLTCTTCSKEDINTSSATVSPRTATKHLINVILFPWTKGSTTHMDISSWVPIAPNGRVKGGRGIRALPVHHPLSHMHRPFSWSASMNTLESP